MVDSENKNYIQSGVRSLYIASNSCADEISLVCIYIAPYILAFSSVCNGERSSRSISIT